MNPHEAHFFMVCVGFGQVQSAVFKEVLAQAQMFKMALTPVVLGSIILAPALILQCNTESKWTGVSFLQSFLNSTSVQESCDGKSQEVQLSGLDVLFVLTFAQVYGSLLLFCITYPFRNGALLRVCIATFLSFGFLALHLLTFRNDNNQIHIGRFAFTLVLGFWLPDIIRKLPSKQFRQLVKISWFSFGTSIQASVSAFLIMGFTFISLNNTESSILGFLLLGIIYPFFTVILRFVFRNFVSQMPIGAKGENSRCATLKLQQVMNESLVCIFLTPGYLNIFLIGNQSTFFVTLGMQVVMEPLSAFAFVKSIERFPSLVVHWSIARWKTVQRRFSSIVTPRRLASLVTPSPIASSNTIVERGEDRTAVRKVALPFHRKVPRELDHDIEAWKGLVYTETVGEKKAMIIGSILAGIVLKDLRVTFVRFFLGMLLEIISDIVKVDIYARHGMITKEFNLHKSFWDYFTAAVNTGQTVYLSLCGISLYCWAVAE